MIHEKVDPRDGAGEFTARGVIVIAQVSDHIVKLQHLVPLVLLFESRVEGDFGHGVVRRRAYDTGDPRRTG